MGGGNETRCQQLTTAAEIKSRRSRGSVTVYERTRFEFLNCSLFLDSVGELQAECTSLRRLKCFLWPLDVGAISRQWLVLLHLLLFFKTIDVFFTGTNTSHRDFALTLRCLKKQKPEEIIITKTNNGAAR